EVSSSRVAPRPQSTYVDGTRHVRGSQGLRRPRFSFFRFTYQTARGSPPPLPRRAREPAKQLPPTQVDDKSPKSEELRRRAIPPSGGAPCVGYICSTAGYCQPRILEFFITSSSAASERARLSTAPDWLVAIADL